MRRRPRQHRGRRTSRDAARCPRGRGGREPRGPGDLLSYETDPSVPGPDHVGIAIDATRMVHAPFTGSTVRIDSWAGVPSRERQFAGAVRPS
ncbi:NlpC/P60 family protein [Microtetraspora sp. NBRC 16547]|uniref:NlpC/P60 family protein n=1 Tax=Microtetraspora sp. NBRC 16547 TaxID=3030993 RepID=UPI00331ACA32